MYKIKLEQFEGPLDLLLQLIEGRELDITQISLAQVTDQYIEFLRSSPSLDPEELADFLVVAAKLLLIKSKAMLPQLALDEGDSGQDLEHQLKIYREYLEALRLIHKIILKKKFSFVRPKPLDLQEIIFSPPPSLTSQKLAQVFSQIINNLEPIVNLPRGVVAKTISIQEKIQEIRNLILDKVTVQFSHLLKNAQNRTEIIVSFLALLELIKQQTVSVAQKDIFSEIEIKRVG